MTFLFVCKESDELCIKEKLLPQLLFFLKRRNQVIKVTKESIPVARGGSRGLVESPFRVTVTKYFSHTTHITSGISSSVRPC